MAFSCSWTHNIPFITLQKKPDWTRPDWTLFCSLIHFFSLWGNSTAHIHVSSGSVLWDLFLCQNKQIFNIDLYWSAQELSSHVGWKVRREAQGVHKKGLISFTILSPTRVTNLTCGKDLTEGKESRKNPPKYVPKSIHRSFSPVKSTK